MASSGVSIKVHGTGKVIRKLTAIGARAADVAPAWPEVAEMISDEVAINFDTQGARFGRPWVPLAASTLADKPAGLPPLVRTGRLRRLLTGGELPMIILGNEMIIGTEDRIGRFQHGGTRRNGRRHIPARVLIKASSRMRRQTTKILGRYVMTGRP